MKKLTTSTEALLIFLIPVEALLAVLVLIFIPGEKNPASILQLSTNRIIMIVALLLIALIFGILIWASLKQPTGRLSIFHLVQLLPENKKLASIVQWLSAFSVIFITTMYWAAWIFFQPYHLFLIRLAPILFFMVLVFFQVLIISLLMQTKSHIKKWLINLLLIMIALFMLVLFLEASLNFSIIVNHAPTQGATDQLAYMDILKTMHDTQYRSIGDASRMPLYLWIQSIFYRSDFSYTDTFQRAKTINICLSLTLLICLFLIYYYSWGSIFIAVVFTMIAAYSIFIFKAAYFTCENLFYFLSFLSFISMVKMFRRPSTSLAILTGISAGLTYLTKASVLPSVMIFIVIVVVGKAWETYQASSKEQKKHAPKITISILHGTIVLFVFFITIMPFGIQNTIQYGGFFKNVNSDIVMWMDSWHEYKEFAQEYPDVRQRLNLAAEIRPGPWRYLHTHTLEQILDRLWSGVIWQLKLIYKPFNQFSYPVLLLLILIVSSLWFFKDINQFIFSNGEVVLFSLSYFIGYMLLFGWYTAIDVGPRFVMGLYLPFSYIVFTTLIKIDGLVKPYFRSIRVIDLITLGLFILVSVDAYNTLSFHLFQQSFGF